MKTKKIISFALSLGLLSSVAFAAVSSVSAADSSSAVDLAVESVSAVAGEQIAISVNANIPDPGITGCEFALTYDPAVITIDSIKEGNISGGTGASDAELKANSGLADTMISGSEYSCLDYSILSDKGVVSVMWATGLEDQSYWIKGEGNFITIMATVNKDAKGSTEIGIDAINRAGSSIKFGYVDFSTGAETSYKVNTTAGTITIGGETTEATETSKPEETTKPDVTTENPGSSSLGEATLKGDATCDGAVDVRDVTLVNQYAVQLSDITDQGKANADVITDGKIDLKDLGQIKKYIIKVITEF